MWVSRVSTCLSVRGRAVIFAESAAPWKRNGRSEVRAAAGRSSNSDIPSMQRRENIVSKITLFSQKKYGDGAECRWGRLSCAPSNDSDRCRGDAFRRKREMPVRAGTCPPFAAESLRLQRKDCFQKQSFCSSYGQGERTIATTCARRTSPIGRNRSDADGYLRPSLASMHSVACGTFIKRSLGINLPVVLQMP